MSAFTEDSRVKIPAILHLTRLGYSYLSLKKTKWDEDTNIFPELLRSSLAAINPGTSPDDIARALQEITLLLDFEDLGKAFHKRLTRSTGLRLIDFENFDNNSFHVVTELPCKNGDDEFRPDITLLINGMPLIYTEVKKPNNRDGILDERSRINRRFNNPKFRRFINISVVVTYDDITEKNFSLSAGPYFDVKVEHVEITPKEFEKELAARTERLRSLFDESRKLDRQVEKQLSSLTLAPAGRDRSPQRSGE